MMRRMNQKARENAKKMKEELERKYPISEKIKNESKKLANDIGYIMIESIPKND